MAWCSCILRAILDCNPKMEHLKMLQMFAGTLLGRLVCQGSVLPLNTFYLKPHSGNWNPTVLPPKLEAFIGILQPKTRTLSPFTHRNAQSSDLTASQRLAEKAPQTKKVDSRAVPWQAWGFRTIVNMLHGCNFSESGYIDYQDVTGSPLLIRYG